MASSLSPLPEDLAEIARTNLSEIPSERGEQIETLRRTILANPEMTNFRTDDAFLLRFLRVKKFDQERAFQIIKNYYKQRQNYAEYIKDLFASNYSHVLSANYHTVLPHKDDQGRPIMVFKASGNLNTMPFNDQTANFFLSVELLLEDDETQSSLKMLFSLAYKCLPAMYKQLHIVNGSNEVLMTIARPFLPKKLKERFVFHGHDLQALHKYIKPEILPEEFGGTLGPFSNSEWSKKMLDQDTVMSENMKYGFTGR